MKNFYIVAAFLISLTAFSQNVNMQNGTFNRCEPDKLFDSGGQSSNYSSNENFVTTICPTNSEDFIILDFTAFSTELNGDFLTVYDGSDTSAPSLGTFSGGFTFGPGTISATPANTSGCLTLQFVTNAAGNGPGFAADILCAEPCQTITASIDSTTPAANGAGVVSILPGDIVNFNGSATFSGDGTGATYGWNFGGGNTATGQNVSHTFPNPGTFTVVLTVTDANPQGCTDTETITVFVLGPNIIVDQTTYTVEELVLDVLIDSPCADVSNITFSTGTNFGQTNGIGYFYGDGMSFPFSAGLLMTTGNAALARGPNNLALGDGGWPGDPYLNTIAGNNTNDATVIEFDFVPLSNSISFDFLMASEEYNGNQGGTFECTYSDAFAFLLTDQNGITTNLAVLPNTTTPILVTNIHPANTLCGAINEQYFGGYTPNSGPPMSFDGRTAVFTAQAPVNPGDTYHIKLVIADALDTNLDSGVFIKAGSFNLGGNIGEDLTIVGNTAPCEADTITLDTQLTTGTFTWYQDGIVIPGETGSTLVVSEPGVYTVDIVLSDSCQTSDSILIEFYPPTAIASVQNLFLCNPGAAPYIFDLTENDALIYGSITATENYLITYYESQAEADSDTNGITTPDAYPGNDGQTIVARLEYVGSDCYSTAAFTLNVLDEPIINAVPDIEVCDDVSNDGFEEFDLETQTATILGGQPAANFVVTYYPTFADADAQSNEITSPYTNISNPQPIYVRLESIGTNPCVTVSVDPVFNLVVNDRAEATQPDDLFICDDSSNDGIGQFDLNPQSAIILGGQSFTDYTVTYYESQTDAETGTGPIGTPNNYTNLSNPQTIYVRVEENATPDCYGYTTFTLNVDPLPTVVVPTPLVECDLDGSGMAEFILDEATAEALNGQTGVTVTYHATLLDAQSGDNDLVSPYLSGAQTIYIRLENTATGCANTSTLNLIINPIPVANQPTLLEACDDNADGFTSFNLALKDAEILNGQTGMDVSYHVSQADADSGDNDLSIPFTNTIAFLQTVYVRVGDVASNCYDTVELDLVVNPLPTVTNVLDYELCDDNNPGDEQEMFMLTDKDAEALNGQSGVDVSYHLSQADALAGTGDLTSPYPNISNPQTIYIRLENSVTGCVNTTSFDLIVNPLPLLFAPTPLVVCDDNVGDGLTSIDLSVKDTEITGGNPQYTVSYHFTALDADSGDSPLSVPYANVVPNMQTVYVRVVDTATGCYDTTELLLQVEQAPVANVPSPLEYCDPDNDGFGEFNLSDAEADVTGGAPGLDVSYHETLANAENNVNPLPLAYDNIVANTQTIYVRVVSSILTSDCATIVPLVLSVLPTPVVPLDIADYAICDTNSDGSVQFDLTTQNAGILGSQNPADYILTYHLSLAAADSGTAPILNVGNYTNVSNPQTIYVRLEGANGCHKTGEFDLVVDLPPVTFQPTELGLCDDDVADELTTFDLTVKDGEITGGDGSLTVEYFTTSAAAQSGTDPISPATSYVNEAVGVNPANPQTLYVRITDNDTGCTSFRTLTIRVLPNPEPMVDPADIILCDDTNTGDGQELFDLTQNQAYILDGAPNLTATYHETLGSAEAGMGAIADPTAYLNTNTDNTPQTIYVRVTNNTSGCYAVVDFDILVNPLPEVVAVADYILCEVNTDGFAQFDLSTKTAEVLNGQDPNLYNVTYHATQTAADNLTGSLNTNYTNTVNPQQIFVAITNTQTGCSISTVSFFLEVDNGAQANSGMEPMELVACDYVGDNDGLAQFDLTENDAAVLDGQDAGNFIVTYYLNGADAEMGVNPIPYIYENTSNPQTIYVRVDNDTPDALGMDSSICYAVAELTLRVDLLPVFDLDDSYTLCVDTNGTEVIGAPVLDTGLSAADHTFEWSLDGTVLADQTGPSLTAELAGTYMVTVINMSTGCMEDDSAQVVISSPPVLTAEVVTQAFSENSVIVATAVGDGQYEYSLDNGPWQESGTFEGVSYGAHMVTARDINGCGTDDFPVDVYDYPHFFTPNGDGYHDTWNIVGFESAKIYIFDRYGKLIKQISPSGQGWDGTYNGEPMPTSDYWFTVEYTEPMTDQAKEFKAHFTLKR